jgi:hypothetical protein
VFFSTANTYFDRVGEAEEESDQRLITCNGSSDGETTGRVRISSEIYPGNLHDAQTLVSMMERLKNQFRMGKAVMESNPKTASAANLRAIGVAPAMSTSWG